MFNSLSAVVKNLVVGLAFHGIGLRFRPVTRQGASLVYWKIAILSLIRNIAGRSGS
jgi:hypothetical protein